MEIGPRSVFVEQLQLLGFYTLFRFSPLCSCCALLLCAIVVGKIWGSAFVIMMVIITLGNRFIKMMVNLFVIMIRHQYDVMPLSLFLCVISHRHRHQQEVLFSLFLSHRCHWHCCHNDMMWRHPPYKFSCANDNRHRSWRRLDGCHLAPTLLLWPQVHREEKWYRRSAIITPLLLPPPFSSSCHL